ncbi:DUF4376 domain-containing protein [Salmonella enterica]|nr:DUF4376 domain-containing protein [Salmonella enterica]ECE0159419.1 DUF4376 domain-containing protein [Salmonella enterica]EID3924322.1 DUF4376 domain-containing protein [Salmonella enterica]EID7413042.1 DUF4376 domain-containing protein [Salmonella enterica]EIL4708216.1 DUF4376 domain-containing protein [Salmonella enterica]
MLYYYSAVKNAFFPDELKDAYQNAGNWPQDALEVEESVFTTYSAPPPEGKQRAAGKDGLPCWVDIPLPDIEDVRNLKHDEINKWRDTQENGNIIFTLNGHQWDCGKASQARLAPVVAVAKSGMLPPDFFWTDAGNVDVPMTPDDLAALETAMQQNMVIGGFKIHERQRQMKEDIARLTSVSDVLNYPVGWPDNNSN